MAERRTETEVLAQELEHVGHKIESLKGRVEGVEGVIPRRSSSPGPRLRSEFRAPFTHSRRRESEGSRRPSRSSPPRRLCRGSDPSQLSHLAIPVATGPKSGPELLCMPLLSAQASGLHPPKRSGNVTPTGEATELGAQDDLCKPGPGIWPLRLAKCQRWGEDGRSPGFRTFLPLRRDKFKGPISPASGSISRPPARGGGVQSLIARCGGG
jgi:hypothetical protein